MKTSNTQTHHHQLLMTKDKKEILKTAYGGTDEALHREE